MNGEEVKREAVRSYTGLPTYDVMREDWRREAYTPLLSAVGNSPDNPQGAPELSPQSPPLSVSVNPSNSPQSVSATPEPSPQPPPAPLPPSPHPTPLSPSIEELSGVVVRTGVLFRRYYLKLKDAEARPGDVLVVVGRDWYVLRPALKADVWVGDGVIRLRGEAVRFSLNAIPQKLLLDGPRCGESAPRQAEVAQALRPRSITVCQRPRRDSTVAGPRCPCAPFGQGSQEDCPFLALQGRLCLLPCRESTVAVNRRGG